MTMALFVWASVSSYSRIYLGVHFPGDIACGALLGMLVGLLTYLIYNYVNRRFNNEGQFCSTAYTSSGFLCSDMHLLAFTLLATYCVVLIAAIPLAH